MVYALSKENEVIRRKDLRVGLVTMCGKEVTGIGRHKILYMVDHLTDELVSNIDTFCMHNTEQCTDEIIEVEIVVSNSGSSYFIDSEDRILPKFKIRIDAMRTGIRKQYNKTKGEFVKGDNNNETTNR